jgi:protein-disulfide isomerase
MKKPVAVLLALAAAALAGAGGCDEKEQQHPAAAAPAPGTAAPAGRAVAPAAAQTPGGAPDLSRIAPGVPVDALTPAQREVLASVLEDEFCYCGCPHTLSGCLREHKDCHHAPRMAALAARLVRGGLTGPEVLKVLTGYYGSFEKTKRATFDVTDFGPPLGDPSAPVTLVEFSDFTCPYCQMIRPRLEAFVKRNAKRVKLYYKPFPLPGHPHAPEAAQAAEWARSKGQFWPMHDLLFENPHRLSVDDLAGYAEKLGLDGADLRKTVETNRFGEKIAAAQREARAAGLTGTPTLYFNGRRFALPDHSEDALTFTLEDEEEFQKNGGWKD